MEKLVCVKKCFYRKRMWVPGETLAPTTTDRVPPHFKPISEVKVVRRARAEKPAEPMTLKGLQDQEAAAEKAAARTKADALKEKDEREATMFD